MHHQSQRALDSRPPNVVTSAARLNHAQIKEQEQLNRERQRQDEFRKERQQSLIQRQRAQYDHVESHGYGSGRGGGGVGVVGGGRSERGATDDVEIRVFVRECDPDSQAYHFFESDVVPTGQAPAAGGPDSARKANAPRSQRMPLPAQPQQAQQPILYGRRASAQQQQRGEEEPGTSPSGRGEVPKYLLKRKAEMQAEKDAIRDEMERQREISQYPPGHRPVSEDERNAILAKLAQRKKELELDLGRLPMRFDTMALRQKRQQIEAEMAEVEAAHQKFSVKKQLFVPI